MAKNNTRRKKDIKSKLIAAICMLLVSTIMMVSSTYAWFTLSTAPEVKGITTSIGANGALEIALSPEDGSLTGVKDATIGTTDWATKNLTWGNLIDLGYTDPDTDNDPYGLGKLTLSPTVLLASGSDNAGSLKTAPLGTPTYGSDGRVSGLNTNDTGIGGLNTDGTGYLTSGGKYGVRAVGTASGLSTQQLAFKSNLAAISNYATKATDAASASISANGSALASMLVQHARAGDPDGNDYAKYVPALIELTSDLDESVTYMQEAVRAALLAAATEEEDAELYRLAIDEINDADWAALKTLAASNTNLNTIVGKIDAIASTVSAAKAKAQSLDDTAKVTWDDAGTAITSLMDTSGTILVNGDTIEKVKDNMNNTDYLVGMVSDGVVITLGKGSGVYYDIAEVAGNITATTTATVESGTSLGTVNLKNVVIKTAYSDISLLPAAKSVINTDITPAGASDDDVVMDTFYGYVIDLMFRTNAADSKLLLQTDAAQRVYDDSNNADTMGGGATLTFKNISSANANSVKGLVQSIRIVFFDPSGNTIYGIAKATTVVTTEDDAGTYTVTGKLELCSYTVDASTGRVTVGDKKTNDDPATADLDESAILCDLQQNMAKAVSCLVYLDGEDVTNADVLYNADVLGALNLQFASSVALDPMDNSELYNGATEAADGDGT